MSDEEGRKQVSTLNALEAFVIVCQRRAELDNYAIDDMRHEFLDYLGVEMTDNYYPHWKRDVSPCIRNKCQNPASCCGCEEYTEWKKKTNLRKELDK
jgi:hypothetical protein